jgi:hypothetical protein
MHTSYTCIHTRIHTYTHTQPTLRPYLLNGGERGELGRHFVNQLVFDIQEHFPLLSVFLDESVHGIGAVHPLQDTAVCVRE